MFYSPSEKYGIERGTIHLLLWHMIITCADDFGINQLIVKLWSLSFQFEIVFIQILLLSHESETD